MSNSQVVPEVSHGLAHISMGEGPTVVCLPGVGDLRSEYDALSPRLVEAGYTVVVADLPGHGDSPVPDEPPSRAALGASVANLLDDLRGDPAHPVHVIGCSLGASAAAVAAALAPERIASLTLIGPFLRDQPPSLVSWLQRRTLSLALRGPWGPPVWTAFRASLFPSSKPPGLTDQQRRIRENLREPGRMSVVRSMALSSCAEVESVLGSISAPTLVVMGTADPDFPDPTAEARWAAEEMGGSVHLVDGAGHYPHLEVPEATATAISTFLRDHAATS